MPPKKKYQDARVGLTADDRSQLDTLAKSNKKTRAQVAREAIRWYLDHQEKLTNDSRESMLEKRMKRMEDRLAALMARTAIDIGMVYHLMYRHMDNKSRDDVLSWAYDSAVKRLRKKLAGQDAAIKELVKSNDPNDSKA